MKYIKDYKGTIIIVSHDRYFLDKVINKIIQIDEGKAKVYFGNYTKYLEELEKELIILKLGSIGYTNKIV